MEYMLKIFMLFLIVMKCIGVVVCLQPPNIIFIYADDLGWNDVSFHGSPQIRTPNIDAMAASGIILNSYYGEYMCTPSRAALMTGKYPMRLGLQHFVLLAGEPSALPLNVTTMPEHFRNLGYATHMVGKWHLGYMERKYTPTYRGFDTFFGYYNSHIDYYNYEAYYRYANTKQFNGIDLHNGTNVVRSYRGEYATNLFTRVATDIIRNHDSSKPLFLYLSEIAPHTANFHNPLQAPPEIIKKFRYIKQTQRRTYAAMVSALDDSVGSIFEALYEKGILENSIIVFASDNGGEVNVRKSGYASNYPLRGRKRTAFEGGIRVPAVLWSPLLGLRESRTSNQLMHVTDWLPTLYKAAGGDVNDLGIIDGHNIWDALKQNSKSPRRELLHLLDPIYGMSALRIGNLKLINGTIINDEDEWHSPTGFEDEHPVSMDEWVFKDNNVVQTILKRAELWLPEFPDAWRTAAVLQCNDKLLRQEKECDPTKAPCLFNINSDPCEFHNLADKYPQMVQTMMEIIYALQEVSEPPQNKAIDPKSHPLCHNFAHVEWMEPEYSSFDCDMLWV